MARQTEELDLAWRSLVTHEAGDGWRTIPVTPAGPCRISAGRRFPGGHEALLFWLPTQPIPAAAALPEGQGFAVERADLDGDGRAWLALARQPGGAQDLFAAMAADVAGALDDQARVSSNESMLLRALLGRASAWQEFMRRGSGHLGPEAEVGLVGELLALRAIIGAGVPALPACEAWVGPRRGPRDFELGTGGIEAKASLSPVGFRARIGSLEQLDDTVRQPLFIAAARLRQVAGGLSLPEWVEDVRDLARGEGDAERVLNERLISAGYLDWHASRYTRRFELADLRALEVTEGFPRLTKGRVADAIVWASYEIDLDRAQAQDIDIEAALRRLGAI
jgi:hypothetical protein